MPKMKTKTNKSQMIRDLLKANPKMPVSEVVAKLAEKNLKVTPNLVYYIRLKMGAKRRRKIRRKVQKIVGGNGDALTLIRSVKELAADAGGLAKLKELVEAIAE
jgi:hypothetical protein